MNVFVLGKFDLHERIARQNILRFTAVLAVALALIVLTFVLVNGAVNASAPLLAEIRIQSVVNSLNQAPLTVQRQQAMSELENAGEGAVPALLVALRSENPVMRQNAADMLDFIVSPQSITALSTSLSNDSVPQIRASAARALGDIQVFATLDTLQRAAVLDKSQMVRQSAADAVARFQTRMAIAAGVNEQDVSAFATAPANSMTAYLATHRDLVITSDGGKTWRTLSNSLPSLVTTLAVSPSDPKVLFTSAEGMGLFKSTDGGITWAAMNTGLSITPGERLNVTAIAFDPNAPQSMFLATGAWIGTSHVEFVPIAVMNSIDGGATWHLYQMSTNVQPITQLALNGEQLYGLAGQKILTLQVSKAE